MANNRLPRYPDAAGGAKRPRCKQCFEPVWRPRRQLPRSRLPEPLRDWLFYAGSLSRRVQRACSGRFGVEVLSQGWERPMLNEVRRLGLRHGRLALVRQVHLLCDGLPWVFARTVIPRTTLSGRRRVLGRLGTRPLGAVLFADPGLRREEMEVCRIRRGQFLFDLSTRRCGDEVEGEVEAVWGRRSVFYLRGKPLLVGEVFMPVACFRPD